MTLFDFSRNIKTLNGEKKFSEALRYFKDNKVGFTNEQIGLNKYLVYEMLTALIESNLYDVIFNFINNYNVVLDPKNFSYLLKKFKGRPSVNWSVVNKFCDLVSVDSLDLECKSIDVVRKGEMKQMELASDKENWYSFKTKALFETAQYEECFQLSKKGLESFDKFHYSNDIWFARRIALSKKNLGNSAEALSELLQILKRKKEWFIQNEVAEIYKENGNLDQAFKYAVEAINNFGDLIYKVGLLVLIGDILEQKQDKERSFQHYSLSKLLREQEEWNVPQSVTLALNRLDFPQILVEELPKLKLELKNYWNGFKPKPFKVTDPSVTEGKQNLEGEIIEILNDNERGKNGFVKSNGSKYYFTVSINFHLTPEISIGKKVIFDVLPATAEKKEQVRIKKLIL